MEVKINREIRNYTESMFFGLSLRQFVFSLLAVGVAVLLYCGSYQAGREICQSAFPQELRQLYQGQHVLGADRAKPQSHAVH